MQTIDANDLVSGPVSGMFEACPEYASGPEASPVCATCGWLDTDHEVEGNAEVRALPERRRPAVTPKRLAS